MPIWIIKTDTSLRGLSFRYHSFHLRLLVCNISLSPLVLQAAFSQQFIFLMPDVTDRPHSNHRPRSLWRRRSTSRSPPLPSQLEHKTWQRWKERRKEKKGKKTSECARLSMCMCVVSRRWYNGTKCQMCPCYIIDDSGKHKVCKWFPLHHRAFVPRYDLLHHCGFLFNVFHVFMCLRLLCHVGVRLTFTESHNHGSH